jgi:hypothetical protein
MHLLPGLALAIAALALLVDVNAASGPPLGPVKGVQRAAPNAFTDQLISRCDVQYHDTILDHFDWVRASDGLQIDAYISALHLLDAALMPHWVELQAEPDGGNFTFRLDMFFMLRRTGSVSSCATSATGRGMAPSSCTWATRPTSRCERGGFSVAHCCCPRYMICQAGCFRIPDLFW